MTTSATALAIGLDPTPNKIASDLIDGYLAAWLHQEPFYGPLTKRWTGQTKPLSKRFALLIHHFDCLLMRMSPTWSAELFSDPLDGDPTGVSITGFDKAPTMIPVEIGDRTIKIGGGEVSIALASNTAGRQILERCAELIGVALGRRVGRRA